MGIWPQVLYLIFCIAAFAVASIAVHGWRDLGILVLLATPLNFLFKWLGPAIGLPFLAGDTVTLTSSAGVWGINVQPSAALLAAVIAAALPIAWKRVRAAEAAARNSGE